jgi:hypothetical protein
LPNFQTQTTTKTHIPNPPGQVSQEQHANNMLSVITHHYFYQTKTKSLKFIVPAWLNYTFVSYFYFRFQFGPLHLKSFNLVSY